MAEKLGSVRIRITVPDNGPTARDLARLIGALNSFYAILGSIELGQKKIFGLDQPLDRFPAEYALRIPALRYASDGDASLFGLEKVLKVVLDTIREWGQKREQEREKTAQAKEKTKQAREQTAQEVEKTRQQKQDTIAKRLSNAKEFLAVYQEIQRLPKEDQERLVKMIAADLVEIEENPIKILPPE